MNPVRRVIVFIFAVAILAQAIVLWGATGSKNTTHLPDRAALRFVGGATMPAAVADGKKKDVKQHPDFHFGLLPSTAALIGRETVSLVTIGAPALLLALLAMAPARDSGKKG